MLVGIIGKTNVGKSTFFKAATLAEVQIEDRPFVTIRPNAGVGFVKVECVDKEFNIKCQPKHGYCLNNYRFVPFQLLDVAGLVPGAHEGKGLGSQFLDDLSQADVFIHIIDVSGSTNEQGEKVATGSYDPANDIKFLIEEFDMWILSLIKKGWGKFARATHQTKEQLPKALGSHLSGLRVTEKLMEKILKELDIKKEITAWDDAILKSIATIVRKETKPMIIACNKIDVPGAIENFKKLKAQFKEYIMIACCSEAELALKEAAKHNLIDYIPGDSKFKIKDETKLSEIQKNALEYLKTFLEKHGSTGIQQVIDTSIFDLINYIAVYPVANSKLQDKDGRYLPDCLLVPKDITAHEFAFKVHTEIGKNFVKAFDLRTKLIVGRDHKLKNRDVIEIIT